MNRPHHLTPGRPPVWRSAIHHMEPTVAWSRDLGVTIDGEPVDRLSAECYALRQWLRTEFAAAKAWAATWEPRPPAVKR